jgi:hypothetical protein
LDRIGDASPKVARHPDMALIASAVQLATAAVFLKEGIERG